MCLLDSRSNLSHSAPTSVGAENERKKILGSFRVSGDLRVFL